MNDQLNTLFSDLMSRENLDDLSAPELKERIGLNAPIRN